MLRPISELLTILLNYPEHLKRGLCSIVNIVYYSKGEITFEEHDILKEYIRSHRPSKYSSFDAFHNRDSAWYWTDGKLKPRVKWLKKHIKINKNN